MSANNPTERRRSWTTAATAVRSAATWIYRIFAPRSARDILQMAGWLAVSLAIQIWITPNLPAHWPDRVVAAMRALGAESIAASGTLFLAYSTFYLHRRMVRRRQERA